MFPFKTFSINKLFDKVPRSFSSIHTKSTDNTLKQSPQQNTHRSNKTRTKAIKIFARFRPLSLHQMEIENSHISLAYPKSQVVHINGNSYEFQKVFTQASSQTEIFHETTSHLINNFFDGYDSTLIAYGQTGSGKTFTMFGDHRKGIIPLAGQQIIRRLNSVNRLFVSVLQIYNQTLIDLLSSEKIKKLSPSIHQIKSIQELNIMINKCHENKKIRATMLNDTSSRSHVVFTLHLEQRIGNQITTSKLCLVDLAGSERIDKSQPSNITETKNINLSLCCLAKTIKALTKKQTYVPFRESKLTQVLQSSLTGYVSMIITCSSHSSCLNQSLNSLRFGVQSKRLQTVSSKHIMNAAQNTVQKVLYDSLKSQLQNYEQKMMKIKNIIENAHQSNYESIYLKQISSIVNQSNVREQKVFQTVKIPTFQFQQQSTLIQNIPININKNTIEVQKLKCEIQELKCVIDKYKQLLKPQKAVRQMKIQYLTFQKQVLLCQIQQLQRETTIKIVPEIRSKDEYIIQLQKKIDILSSLITRQDEVKKKVVKLKKLSIKN